VVVVKVVVFAFLSAIQCIIVLSYERFLFEEEFIRKRVCAKVEYHGGNTEKHPTNSFL
jgi:hypothetical protein